MGNLSFHEVVCCFIGPKLVILAPVFASRRRGAINLKMPAFFQINKCMGKIHRPITSDYLRTKPKLLWCVSLESAGLNVWPWAGAGVTTEPYLSWGSSEVRWKVTTAVKTHLIWWPRLASDDAPNSLPQTRTGFSLKLVESLCLQKRWKSFRYAF